MPARASRLRRAAPTDLAAALGLGTALIWALSHYGGTQPQTPYLLLSILLAPVFLSSLAAPAPARPGRTVVLASIGVVLLARVALAPAVEAGGYVHLALGWAALALALSLASRGRRGILALAGFLVLLGAAETAYGLAQALGGHDYIGSYFRDAGRVATGTFINRSHFAGLVNMAIGLAIGLAHGLGNGRDERRAGEVLLRWLLLAGAAIMGLAVLLSLSRGGALALLASLAFAWWLERRSDRSSRAVARGAMAVGLVALAITTLAFAAGLGSLWTRLEKIPQTNRPALYGDTLAMIAEHPVLGVGPGMYRWRFRPFQGVELDRLYEHAHNDYLESAAEWGVPLALAFWGFILWRWRRCCTVFRTSDDRWERGVALGSATAIVSILVHSLVDFNLQIPSNAMFFFVIVALAWSLEAWPAASPRTDPSDRSHAWAR